MIDSDLMRSYYQYKKHQEVGHLKISFFKKILLSLLFFMLIPSFIFKVFYLICFKRDGSDKGLYIFPFTIYEPMKSIVAKLESIENTTVVNFPKALPIFPTVLLKDFGNILFKKPFWTLKNLDFFGALAFKILPHYGYKMKYNISKLLLLQEYSFYSSYLTHMYESENGSLYNIMHGIPGEEASFFRFTKCFVWGEYFKDFYIKNHAKESQFVIAGSIYHKKLLDNYCLDKENKVDILYALQGDKFIDRKYTQDTYDALLKVQKEVGITIAVKPHPRFSNSDIIPKSFIKIDSSPIKSICDSTLIISHFSTILLDAKVVGKNVLAFVPLGHHNLVNYLEFDEIVYDKDTLYESIVNIFHQKKDINTFKSIINLQLDTKEIIIDAIS